MSVSKKLSTVVIASAFAALFASGISTAAPHPAGNGIDYTIPHPLSSRLDYSDWQSIEGRKEAKKQSRGQIHNAPVPNPLSARNDRQSYGF